MRRIFRVIAGVLLLVAAAFLLGVPTRDISVPNLSEETILTGGVVGAIVGFLGVLIAQYLAGKRHSEALLHARELEAQRAQQAALQKYFEQMGELLADTDRPLHRSTLGDNLSTVARAQTLSILEGLNDPTRKRILLQFLYESALINKDKPVVGLIGANLRWADLSEAKLSWAELSGADLRDANLVEGSVRRAYSVQSLMSAQGLSASPGKLPFLNRLAIMVGSLGVSLRGANLSKANLRNADLAMTKLSWAKLSQADLKAVNLSGAKLKDADLRDADLTDASLPMADLRRADLSGAKLRDADLRGASLKGTKGLAQEQIEKAIRDHTTKLPAYLQSPESWSKSPDEQPKKE